MDAIKGGEGPEDREPACEAFADKKLVGGKPGGKALRRSAEADQVKYIIEPVQKSVGEVSGDQEQKSSFFALFLL